MKTITENKNRLGADPYDFNDVLAEIQKDFKFKFDKYELKDVTKFGELCDVIISKLNYKNCDECTSQHTFYRIRSFLVQNFGMDPQKIKPSSTLNEIFGKTGRHKKIKMLEHSLGIRIKILEPSRGLVIAAIFMLLVSVGTFLLDRSFGLILFSLFVIFLTFVINDRSKFKFDTLSEAIYYVMEREYFFLRRDKSSVNPRELNLLMEKKILRILPSKLKKLNRDTRII